MKIFKSALVLILSFAFISAHAAKVESDLEKLSYSMGIFFGQSVSRQGMELDNAAFLQAVEDILNSSELKLSKEEMQQILSDYQKKEQEELDEIRKDEPKPEPKEEPNPFPFDNQFKKQPIDRVDFQKIKKNFDSNETDFVEEYAAIQTENIGKLTKQVQKKK